MPFRGHALITDFTGGEISPRWLARVQGGERDPLQGGGTLAQVYQSGCRDLTNMIVLPQGGVVTRPGTEFKRDITADTGALASDPIRTVVFEQQPKDFFVLFTAGFVWVYETSSGNELGPPVFSAPTPYTADKLPDLNFTQIQDAMLVFYGDNRPRILRLRGGGWTFLDAEGAALIPPTYDFRDGDSPPRQQVGWNIRFDLGSPSRFTRTFISGVLSPQERWIIYRDDPALTLQGLLESIRTNRAVVASSVSVTYIGDGLTSEFEAFFQVIATEGDGSGNVAFDEAYFNQLQDSYTVTAVDQSQSGGEPLWSGPLIVDNGGTIYNCYAPHISNLTNEPGVGADWRDYWVVITKDPNTDYTEVEWQADFGYGPYNRGWPTTGTGHEQRLIANGGREARGVIAGSRTGLSKFLDFTVGSADDDAFVFLLAGTNGLAVSWLHSQKLLMVGTSAGLYTELAVPITPTSVVFSQQSAYTIANVPGENVAGEVFYVQRNTRSLRQVQYVDELQSWQSTDMSAYAEHLFTPNEGIRGVAYQPSPDSILWVLRGDRAWLGFTYEKFYGVMAWHKHASQDPLAGGTNLFDGVSDAMNLVFARRVWNGVAFEDRLILESISQTSANGLRFSPVEGEGDWVARDTDPSEWLPRLDSYERLTGTGTATIVVAERFWNRVVSVVEDGVYLGDFTPDAVTGVITLPQATVPDSAIVVGFSYKARIVPNRIELAAAVTSQSQKIRWTRPMLRLVGSVMPLVNGRRPSERAQDDLYDTATGLYTGDVEVGNLGSSGELEIVVDRPLPFHMTGLFGLITLQEG